MTVEKRLKVGECVSNTQLILNNIDMSDWRTYRFDEIAQRISKTVKPEESEVDVYVGLEHIDSEDIQIRRRGVPSDVKGGKLRCSPGDVIFGKRRAYQRKAAIVDFEGICSAHAFVFRANSSVIDPKLFPFFLHSDQFMHRMVDISVGGLSPTINWGDLKHQEFLLPPKEKQLKIADLLWGIDLAVEKEISLKNSILLNAEVYFTKKIFQFKEDIEHGKLSEIQLQNLIVEPISNGVFKKKENFGSGVRLINVTDIYSSFVVVPESLERVAVTEKEISSFSALPGDIIFNRSSLVKEGIGHTCLVPEYSEDMVFECHLMRVRPNKQLIDPRFLCRYCLSVFGRNYLISRSQTTTMTTLNQGGLNNMPIPIPEYEEQIRVADQMDDFEKNADLISAKIKSSKTLQKVIINQVF